MPDYNKPLEEDETISPLLRQRMQGHHLSVFLGEENGGWLAIVPGMVIALVTDRSKIDGIAPYVITEINLRPGRETITMVAHGKPGTARRVLKLGALYKGMHTQSHDNADSMIDAVTAAKKMADKE